MLLSIDDNDVWFFSTVYGCTTHLYLSKLF